MRVDLVNVNRRRQRQLKVNRIIQRVGPVSLDRRNPSDS